MTYTTTSHVLYYQGYVFRVFLLCFIGMSTVDLGALVFLSEIVKKTIVAVIHDSATQSYHQVVDEQKLAGHNNITNHIDENSFL
jgi:hypothetical protein